MRIVALVAGALALAASSAQAQLVVGNDQSGVASIYHIDVGTGVATAIYSASTSEAKPWGMAYDKSTNTLYWNNGSSLYSSPFSMSLTPTLLGTMTFNSATVNFVGLGFRNGALVGTRNITTEAVYTINVNTLAATQTYVYPSAFDFGGVDVDIATDLLYGLNDSATGGSGRGLYEIDDANATTTFKAPYPANETDIDGLAVFNGRAYYVTDGPNSSQSSFYIYDVATGQLLGTLASPFTGSGTFAAAAYIPAPGTAAFLAMLGVGAVGRRR